MASDYTFDLTPARRPSLDDLGGAAKQDHARFPPNPVTMPTARNWNQFARFMEGAGKLLPFCVIHVSFAAGVPFIVSVQSMRSSLVVGSFPAPTDKRKRRHDDRLQRDPDSVSAVEPSAPS